jgi:hypothetical protein
MASGQWTSERTFIWQRTSPFKDCFELYAGGQPLARLTIGGLAVTTAQLETDAHRLVFTAEGVGDRRVRIVDVISDQVVANFERRWSGRTGTVRFAEGGGALEWRRTGLWRPVHVFTDRFGNPLIRFDPDGGATGFGLGTEQEPPIGSWRDLVVLLGLGWFLMVVAGNAVQHARRATRLTWD